MALQSYFIWQASYNSFFLFFTQLILRLVLLPLVKEVEYQECNIQWLNAEIILAILQQIPDFDNLYLDMNGIIHICSHPNDNDPHFRMTEEKMFQDIFHYIEVSFIYTHG